MIMKKIGCNKRTKLFFYYFGFPKDVNKHLKTWNWIYHRKQIIFSWEWNKSKIEQLFSKYKNRTIIMNTENSWTNKPHNCVLNLSQELDWRSSNKHLTLQNLPIYYTRNKIRN